MEHDTDEPGLAENWLVQHTLTTEECASDAFGIFLIFFSCLYTESSNVIKDVGGPPLGSSTNGRFVRPVCVYLDAVEQALHRYHSQFATVSSMKADIVDNVFRPRVWDKLVADHASGWKEKTTPHIPSWGPIQLYTFISNSEELRVMLNIPLIPVTPAHELISSSAVVDVDGCVADICSGLLADPEEELQKQLLSEHDVLRDAIVARVQELVDTSHELEGDRAEGGGEDGDDCAGASVSSSSDCDSEGDFDDDDEEITENEIAQEVQLAEQGLEEMEKREGRPPVREAAAKAGLAIGDNLRKEASAIALEPRYVIDQTCQAGDAAQAASAQRVLAKRAQRQSAAGVELMQGEQHQEVMRVAAVEAQKSQCEVAQWELEAAQLSQQLNRVRDKIRLRRSRGSAPSNSTGRGTVLARMGGIGLPSHVGSRSERAGRRQDTQSTGAQAVRLASAMGAAGAARRTSEEVLRLAMEIPLP